MRSRDLVRGDLEAVVPRIDEVDRQGFAVIDPVAAPQCIAAFRGQLEVSQAIRIRTGETDGDAL